MKFKIVTIGSLFLVLVSLCLVTLGCAVTSIVGKWQDTASSTTIEFTETGDYIVADMGYVDHAKYELIGKGIVRVTFSDNSTYEFPYTISGNTLKTSDAQAMTFKRISK